MFRRVMTAGALSLLLMGAAPVSGQFLASDLIYVPGSAHNEGVGNSLWRTDLFITNVEEIAVDVAIVYLPTGLVSNTQLFANRDTWLGGREEQGFGFVNPALADILPGATIVLRDVVGEYWRAELEVAGSGALVVFSYEAGTLEDDGSRVLKNVIVNSRIYNTTTIWEPDPDSEGEFLEVPATYGQTMPGVPWYNMADPSAIGENGDFSFQILTGATSNAEYRYNLGIVNTSDPLTSVTVMIQPFQGDGEPFVDDNGNPLAFRVVLPPASNVQYNNVLNVLFGLEDVSDDVSIDVSILSWSSTNVEPIPGITTYGAYVDNRSNDPTAVLPAFAFPYNVECQWGPPGGGGSTKGAAGPRKGPRPLEIPAR